MSLSYKSRRRWALVVLLIGLPVYIVVAIILIGLLPRPNFLVELGIYLVLGIVWALPFRYLFRGVGQADPEASDDGT